MKTLTYPGIKKMTPQLLVADLERSIAFYTETLGFSVEFRYEDFYAGIVRDGFSIHLKLGKPSIEVRESKRRNEDLDLVFSVEDIEGCYELFTARSIAVVQPLRQMPYGMEFYIADPDGYILSFLGDV